MLYDNHLSIIFPYTGKLMSYQNKMFLKKSPYIKRNPFPLDRSFIAHEGGFLNKFTIFSLPISPTWDSF